MSELESFEYIQRQLLVGEVTVMLDMSMLNIQQAPDGYDDFKKSFPFVQDQYGQALGVMAAMQRKLGIDATLVEHPDDIAGQSSYSRQAVVESALHTIIGSPILHYNEKTELTDNWVELTSGRRNTFSTKTNARLFAISSLTEFGALHDIKDAHDIAVELAQRPFVRATTEVQERLGRLSIRTSK